MRYRKITEGVLVAPARGRPEPPVGYERAPGNLYVFLIKIPPCPYREIKMVFKSCCGEIPKIYCNEFGMFVTRIECTRCPKHL